MLLRPRPFLALAAAVALAACPEPSKPTPVADAGVPTLPVDAGVDAGMPLPVAVELTVSVSVVFPDGGASPIDLQPGTRPLTDPPAGLDVTLRPQLKNYRVRLFDDADKVVESNDEANDQNPANVDYRIRFQALLKTGRHYALVVDAQTGEAIVDRQGLKHPDLRLEFQVSGEKERPPGSKPPKKKKHK